MNPYAIAERIIKCAMNELSERPNLLGHSFAFFDHEAVSIAAECLDKSGIAATVIQNGGLRISYRED